MMATRIGDIGMFNVQILSSKGKALMRRLELQMAQAMVPQKDRLIFLQNLTDSSTKASNHMKKVVLQAILLR